MSGPKNNYAHAAHKGNEHFIWVILGAALIMRWLHSFLVADSDLVQVPIIDAAFYHQWALDISRGNILGDSIFFMSPLYPYLMGLIYALAGASPMNMMLVQGIFGVALVWLIFRIGARVAGRAAGLTAAAIAAVYTPFIFYDATLLTASLILLLSAVILFLVYRAVDGVRRTDFWLLGVAIGFSALARPLVLLFMPFYLYALYRHDRALCLRRFSLVAAGTALVLIPIGIRNLVVGGEFTLTTSSAGMNFYVGNNPDATGLYWEAAFLSSVEPAYEDQEYRRIASERMQRELTTREAGRFWMRQALDWMLNSPIDYIKLTVKKAFYFWNRTEFANNVSIYLGKSESAVLRYNPIGFWLIAPLGLGGLILMWRKLGWRRVGVLWLWLIAYFVGALLFFVASEYRLPAMLALIIGSGYLIVELANRIKLGKPEPILRILALGIVLMPFTNFRTDFIGRGENARMDWFNIGNTFVKRGEYKKAIPRFEKALEVNPQFPEAMLALAGCYYRIGDEEKAVEIGKRAGLEDPKSILKIVQGEALREAYMLLDEGNFTDAMREFGFAGRDTSFAAAETTRVSILMQAQLDYRDGRREDALKKYKDVVTMGGMGPPIIPYNIAFIHWQLGEMDSAETYARHCLSIDSLYAPAAQLLARIFRATDRRDEADRLMQQAFPDESERAGMLGRVRAEMDSLTHLAQWEKALGAYTSYGRRFLEMESVDKLRVGRLQIEVGNIELGLRLINEAESEGVTEADLNYHQGRALVMLGRYDEGMEAFRKCIAAHPEKVEARVALARLYAAKGNPKRAWNELDEISHLEILNPKLAKEYRQLRDSLKTL